MWLRVGESWVLKGEEWRRETERLRGGRTPQNYIIAATSAHASKFCSANFLSPLPKEFRE